MGLENIKQVAVIGAGAMGAQIPEVLSRVGGYRVMMTDINDELVNKGIQALRDTLQKHFVDKGKITADEMRAIADRIKGTTGIPDAVKNADYVIEAASENMEIKKIIYKQLDENAPPHTILATNTSGLNVTEIGNITKRPDKVAGMHFFNPVAIMRLVEVVRGAMTSDETANTVCEISRKLGKEPVVCRDVGYGFLANRAYLPMRNEAVQMVWEHVASPEDIDKALKLGYNLPIGPLELGDFTGGWGIGAASEQDLIREMGEAKGSLHPLIRLMGRAGYTGGRGKNGIYAFWRDSLSKW